MRARLCGGLGLLLLSAGCATPGLSGADRERLAASTAVITGASSGFGRGVALAMGRAHANVVLAARRGDVLAALAQEIDAAGGHALAVPTDVSDPAQVEALERAAVARFGHIDVWINDAGIGAIGRFGDVPLADHARVIDVNVKGTIYGSWVAINQFRRQGYGTLVNISSVEGKIAVPYHSSYAASKHAILGLDVAIGQELRLDHLSRIHVSSVMPWAADTPFFTHAANHSGGTPRMVLFDDPDKVVDAIVRTSLHPRPKVAVGFKAQAAITAYQVEPGLAETVSANIMHHAQVTTAPPAPPTEGALFTPMPAGTTTEGGVRDRMKREDAARKANGGTPADPPPSS